MTDFDPTVPAKPSASQITLFAPDRIEWTMAKRYSTGNLRAPVGFDSIEPPTLKCAFYAPGGTVLECNVALNVDEQRSLASLLSNIESRIRAEGI